MPAPGDMIDEYQIVKRLAHGAFGEVILAEGPGGPSVVIKVGAPEDVSQSTVREGTFLGKFHHPGLANVVGSGRTADGRPYLVREYVDGESLEEVLRHGPLPPDDALAVAEALADVLAAVHAAGFIHRDLKPSNVVVPPGPDSGRFAKARLLDFGVVGQLQAKTNATLVGQVFGTPLYMAPEQLRGESQTPAADVYGLGVLLYALLYGRPPFADVDNVAAVMFHVLEDPVPIPPTPKLPPGLRDFLLRCLAKKPQDRFRDGSELLAEIRQVRDGTSPTVPWRKPSTTGSEGDRDPSSGASWPAVPSPIGPKSQSTPLVLVAVLGGVLAILLLAFFAGRTVLWSVAGIILGLLLAGGGVLLGRAVRRWLSDQRTDVARETSHLLIGARSRESLSQSLAIELDGLLERCRAIDQRLLGMTLAMMMTEYESAKDSAARQSALLNAVGLLEKLMTRLSPWYVRHDKAIATGVTFTGIATGAVSVVKSVVDLTKSVP